MLLRAAHPAAFRALPAGGQAPRARDAAIAPSAARLCALRAAQPSLPSRGRSCRLVVRSSAADLPVPDASASVSAAPPALSVEETKLANDARTVRGLCWISFWGQLALSCVSGVILVFSVTVREGMMPPPSTWLALVGVATAVVSTFLAWSFRRTATALSKLAAGVTPRDLIKRLEAGAQLNLAGMGATILALQAEVGSLLAKTLTSSAANPYAKVADAPVAFDVFAVQASANTIMAHFCSILLINWTLRIINRRVRLMAEAMA